MDQPRSPLLYATSPQVGFSFISAEVSPVPLRGASEQKRFTLQDSPFLVSPIHGAADIFGDHSAARDSLPPSPPLKPSPAAPAAAAPTSRGGVDVSTPPRAVAFTAVSPYGTPYACLQYSDVAEAQSRSFWYRTGTDPRYASHDDVLYPLHRDASYSNPWHLTNGISPHTMGQWDDLTLPQWVPCASGPQDTWKEKHFPRWRHYRSNPVVAPRMEPRGSASTLAPPSQRSPEVKAAVHYSMPSSGSPSPSRATQGVGGASQKSEDTTPTSHVAWSLSDFEVGHKIGEGQFGQIFLCKERASGQAVVIKSIMKDQILSQGLLQPLRQEIELQHTAGLLSPYILRLHAYFWDDQRVFLVLEYADGGNLQDFIRQQPSHCIPEDDVRRLAKELLMAVDVLHACGIVHRDIKPENILLHEGKLKLADFSCAASLGEGGGLGSTPSLFSQQTTSSYPNSRQRRYSLCGTWDYWAPEVMSRRGGDTKADMWSVGIVIYELLCGYTPFEQLAPLEAQQRIGIGEVGGLPHNLSREARSFLRALLCVDESERLNTKEAMAHPFLTQETVDGEEDYSSLLAGYGPPPPPVFATPVGTRYLESPTSNATPCVRLSALSPSEAKDVCRSTTSSQDNRSASESTLPELLGTHAPPSAGGLSQGYHEAATSARLLGAAQGARAIPSIEINYGDVTLSSSSSVALEDSARQAAICAVHTSILNLSAMTADDSLDRDEKSLLILPHHHSMMRSPDPAVTEPALIARGQKSHPSRSSSEEFSHGPTLSYPRSYSNISHGLRSSSSEVPEDILSAKCISADNSRVVASNAKNSPRVMMTHHQLQHRSSHAGRQLSFSESDSDEELKMWALSEQHHSVAATNSESKLVLSSDDFNFHMRRRDLKQVHSHPSCSTSTPETSGSSTFSCTILISQPAALDCLSNDGDDDDESSSHNDSNDTIYAN